MENVEDLILKLDETDMFESYCQAVICLDSFVKILISLSYSKLIITIDHLGSSLC